MLRRLDSAGERTHRQLIDCIRSKDTDALIDAIDSGGIEVNFMDDVGQTLLNWASAFGTQEMVEFLCERCADVNKGQRSSSLHYVIIVQFSQFIIPRSSISHFFYFSLIDPGGLFRPPSHRQSPFALRSQS
jgi:ankyrin repeat protein